MINIINRELLWPQVQGNQGSSELMIGKQSTKPFVRQTSDRMIMRH